MAEIEITIGHQQKPTRKKNNRPENLVFLLKKSINFFDFVKNSYNLLNCIVYAFKMFKQNAIFFYGFLTNRLLKSSLFSKKQALSKFMMISAKNG